MGLNILFVIGLAFLLAILFSWAFRSLPKEDKQFLAALPVDSDTNGGWRGRNITYYGLMIASGGVMGVGLLIVLLGSISVALLDAAVLIVFIFALCAPSARIIARIVEKKQNTFTIGGASFLGIAVTPFVIWLMNKFLGPMYGFHIPIMATFAAFSIAYSLGESMGRLGCLSFGCCYGKPMSKCGPLARKLLSGWGLVFRGRTKKISYAGDLEGQKVFPVQALTSIILAIAALIGVYLYLNGMFISAFLCCMVVTQGWRAISELFRADYRGDGKISSYQYMAIIALIFSFFIAYWAPAEKLPSPDVINGIKALWNPGVILLLQGIGLIMLFYFGLSTVTESRLSFRVLKEKI